MDPHFPNRPREALSPSEMLARVRTRGARLRRRRQMGVTGLAVAAAGTAAAVVWAVIPAGNPHRIVSTAPTPSPTVTGSSCPASSLTIDSAAAGSLRATPDFTSGAYRHLGVGQTAVLFAGGAPADQSITLTRGVDTNSFAVSIWSGGPKPLVPLTVLATSTDLYPAGDGTPGARIPFRYPEAGSQANPCQRYQLEALGVDDATLVRVAKSLVATTTPPATNVTTTAPAPAPANTSLDSVFGQPLKGPATVTVTADGLYVAITQQSSSGATNSTLQRVDPTTGHAEAAVSLGAPFVQATEANGSLWLTTSSTSDVTLIRFDPQTLRETGHWTLGTPPQQTGVGSMAVAGGGLWVTTGDRLLRLSLSDGSILASVSIPGAVGSDVASDAAGTILIDGRLSQGGGAVERRDPTTGTLIASYPMSGVTAPRVTGVVGGSVWVSEATGMMGFVERLDATSLRPAPTDPAYCAPSSTPTCISGSNAINATTANGLVWITQNSGGDERNHCADATTGKTLAPLALPQPADDEVVAIGPADVYFTFYNAGAYRLAYKPIPTACRAS